MTSSTYNDSSEEINTKDANFKIGYIVRILNIKIFLQKVTLQVGLKKFLWLEKIKICY